ncbi:MAG: proliferating cell nuclear antigen (pcna) [Sulfobacillus sp.]
MIELEVRTIQSSPIQKQFDALKELLSDTNLVFTEEGMKIVAMDESHTVLVLMTLHRENFQVYNCPHRQVIGLNLPNLNKIFKAMSNKDVISFLIDSNRKDKFIVRLENAEQGQTEFEIDIMDIDEEEIEFPEQDYPYVITMPIANIQKLCRDMKLIGGKTVDIIHHKGELIFSTVGDTIAQRTTRPHVIAGSPENVRDSGDRMPANGTYQGRFNLEKLLEFCRGVSSPSIQLMLKNDMPLLFKYLVGSLGENTFCLAPMCIQ